MRRTMSITARLTTQVPLQEAPLVPQALSCPMSGGSLASMLTFQLPIQAYKKNRVLTLSKTISCSTTRRSGSVQLYTKHSTSPTLQAQLWTALLDPIVTARRSSVPSLVLAARTRKRPQQSWRSLVKSPHRKIPMIRPWYLSLVIVEILVFPARVTALRENR